MQSESIGAFAPLSLLIVALSDWSLLTLPFLLAFIFVQHKLQWASVSLRTKAVCWGFLLAYSTLSFFAEGSVAIVWSIKGTTWTAPSNKFFELLGLVRFGPQHPVSHKLIILGCQFLSIVTAAFAVRDGHRFGNWLDFSWGGPQFRAVLRSILLPAVQLAAGIGRPCWISFPFFICSCIGLFHWSITGDFVGLAWGWRKLLCFTGLEIVLLYLYQLPFEFPEVVLKVANFVGFFRLSEGQCGWLEGVQGVALVAFYIVLSVSIYDVEEADQHNFHTTDVLPRINKAPMLALSRRHTDDSPLMEKLLGSLDEETRPPRAWTTSLPNSKMMQSISINFFTYGFPVCLVVLLLWSFKYASLSAFLILVYVGYVIYAFPAVPTLWRLNTALLIIILLWSLCTYMFNAIFTVLHDELDKDTQVWNTIGFWHYLVPGLFLLVQFVLGVLIGTGMYFCNIALRNMHVLVERSTTSGNAFEEELQDKKMLLLAIMAWCIHRSAHTVSLLLLFVNGTRHGLIGAVYMVFFLVYLLRLRVSPRMRRHLIIFSEIHFGALYLLQLDLISSKIDGLGSWMQQLLAILGVSNKTSPRDFLVIASVMIFSALQSHGLELLLSVATFIEKSQLPPLGFEIFRSTNGRPVLVCVCASENLDYFHHGNNFTVQWITRIISGLGETIRAAYRSFGTPIAAVTVLFVVFVRSPNYISFGYFLFLLYWMVGRQLNGRTCKALWFPLFGYSVGVFAFHYTITCFPGLQKMIGKFIDLYRDLGFKPAGTFIDHLWDSLLILVVMQLFRYERAQKCREGNACEGDHTKALHGFVAFLKRFLILHSSKILSITAFYASVSPVGATGFIYILMLVVTCMLPKTMRFPAKLFAVYTALLAASEFLFQLFAERLQLLPNQTHGPFMYWLGFRVIQHSFWGWELSFQSRVLVFASCLLQYSAFGWLDELPTSLRKNGKHEEPCFLFVPYAGGIRREKEPLLGKSNCTPKTGYLEVQSEPSLQVHPHRKDVMVRSQSLQENLADLKESLDTHMPADDCIANHLSNKGDSSSTFLGVKQSRQWSKRAMLTLRRERYEAQVRTLKTYAMHLMENLFHISGMEISMFVLLFASFTVLNAISLFYIVILSLCILLERHMLKGLWPYCVILFGLILLVEYVLYGGGTHPWNVHHLVGGDYTRCHTCWQDFHDASVFCSKCWLGIVVDDLQTLVAYFMVFFVGCLKLRSDLMGEKFEVVTFQKISFPSRDRVAWKEINYETKGQWTWLDRLRFSVYRHFLDMVLLLVFITGTLQYDVLHLGYLAFALVFSRMRVTILKTRMKMFRYLQLYNFLLIVLSLLYQAPYLGSTTQGGFNVFDAIGFVKIPYGFDITSQSILVDITIFCVVLIQTCIFCSKEYGQVLRYMEAEEVDVKLEAQEAKAAWKTEQLQRIRNMEESKQQRRLQVEKMKSEMLHLQLNVEALNSSENMIESKGLVNLSEQVQRGGRISPENGSKRPPMKVCNELSFSQHRDEATFDEASSSCRRRTNSSSTNLESSSASMLGNQEKDHGHDCHLSEALMWPQVPQECSATKEHDIDNGKPAEIVPTTKSDPNYEQSMEKCVANVQQSLSSKALANITDFLNIDEEPECDTTDGFSIEGGAESWKKDAEEIEGDCLANIHKNNHAHYSRLSCQRDSLNEVLYRAFVLYSFLYSKMRANTDVLCYFFFLLAYLWDFSLLMLFYPASLYLYALLENPGPSQGFWLMMLIFTEFNILLQYMNQVLIHHTEQKDVSSWLSIWLLRVGIPTKKMTDSFVSSVLPLFLVYLSALVQSSIKARDGEWMSVLNRKETVHKDKERNDDKLSLAEKLLYIRKSLTAIVRGFFRYFQALLYGSEAPPHFVQVSMCVKKWPDDGIQPERIASAFNGLLKSVHLSSCTAGNEEFDHKFSTLRVESIESSPMEEDVVIAVLEVIYASPSESCPASEHYKSLTPAKDVAQEIHRAKEDGLIDRTILPFPILSVIPGGKREVDFYAYIFGSDLLAFFFVTVFYQSFIKNSPDFLNVYQLEDQFPKEFVFVLMTLFFLIVMDRVIYLCSFAPGKVIYYFFNLGLLTYYATYYDWQMSTKEHGLLLLRVFCFIKGLSLSLQASQIKYGLPNKTALYQQFLTRKVSYLNYIGFRLYRSLPFLFELRCILDWSCSTTSLTMYDWLKLEDIHASLFLVKCDGKLSRMKHQLGEKRGTWSKFLSGICTFLVLICIIWTPMLMYSSGNPSNFANPILDVRVQIDLSTANGRFTLYQTSLCQIHSMEDLVASNFTLNDQLQVYELRDMQLICCEADADTVWLVPPPTLTRLANLVLETFDVIAKWEFSRQRPKTKEIAYFRNETFAANVDQSTNNSFSTIRIPELHPKYFRVTSTGEVRMLEGTTEMVSGNLTLHEASQPWWSFSRDISMNEGCGSLDGPLAITVSEEVPQGFLGDTLSRFSIASLYITFVLAVGRFIRLQCADLRMRIPYENLPSCDRLVAICEDIYAARAAGELVLEEGLFWTLVRIYRSSHALLEYTKAD